MALAALKSPCISAQKPAPMQFRYIAFSGHHSIYMLRLFGTEKRDDSDCSSFQLFVSKNRVDFIGNRLRLLVVAVVPVSRAAFDKNINKRWLNAF